MDNNHEKIGSEFCNKQIVSPEDYLQYDFDYILVASSFECEIIQQLMRLGVEVNKIITLNYFLNFKKASVLSHCNTSKLFYSAVGTNGCNLSIIILSYNRADMTIRLLKSIESKITNFSGQIIVFDNCSEPDQLTAIKDYISHSSGKRIILIEADTNYGVAKARNLATGYANKDWLFFIDNDIYFTDNPLPTINTIIENHNALYINLPLLNSDGINLYAYGGSVVYDDINNIVRIESFFSENSSKEYVEQIVNGRVFFGSFVFGGTSVYHKDSFISTGMFDDSMFIGFEDVDYSIRLLQRGIKIANAPIFCMIHDHADNTNKEYNNVRYSNEIIKKSASVFFEKHKCNIYSDNVEKWLSNRNASSN